MPRITSPNSCKSFLLSLARALLVTAGLGQHAVAAAPDHWVGTWATSPIGANNPGAHFGAPGTDGTTLREIVHLSLGGSSLRVVFTNEFGTDPLTIGAAQIALSAGAGALTPATATPLTFAGQTSIIIPPGALILSDPASLKVPAFADVAVSLFLPDQPVSRLTLHGFADQTSYFVPGNLTSATTLETPTEIFSWDFLKGVDVQAGSDSGSIVAFGDSITDGALSTRNANARWPDILSRRLAANKKTAQIGMLNEGIGGNRVLHDGTGPSALARFDRDVIAQAGVKYVILMESINDIGHAADPVKPYDIVSAAEIIAGLSQMADRAHIHGIKAIGATLTPYLGAKYASPAGEEMRQAVNQWIRTSPQLDGVIDFEKATRDPANPGAFQSAYDSGDHLHPKDAGYKAMGEFIDLSLFTK